MPKPSLLFGLIFLPFVAAAAADVKAAVPASSHQYGAVRLDFQVGDHRAFLIQPSKPAADGTKPWVWYAPTFIGQYPDDSHAWMANQLLDAGFAIAGVEVGESYGSPAGRRTYTEFHDLLVKEYGLDAKACLLPQSRGGLMLLNWAVEHPDQVECIAGIYAVCNIESYPGIDKAAGAYEMDAATLRAHVYEHNPIDRLKPLADAKVPVFFIHGDSDKVVPVEANAGELVKRYQSLGGPARLVLVPGKGHEVCPEFFQAQEFVDFLLHQGHQGVQSLTSGPAAVPHSAS